MRRKAASTKMDKGMANVLPILMSFLFIMILFIRFKNDRVVN